MLEVCIHFKFNLLKETILCPDGVAKSCGGCILINWSTEAIISIPIPTYILCTERTKLLTDAATDSSTESDGEDTKPVESPVHVPEPPVPTKDAGIAVEELAPQEGTQDQPVSAPHSELPPPYESSK